MNPNWLRISFLVIASLALSPARANAAFTPITQSKNGFTCTIQSIFWTSESPALDSTVNWANGRPDSGEPVLEVTWTYSAAPGSAYLGLWKPTLRLLSDPGGDDDIVFGYGRRTAGDDSKVSAIYFAGASPTWQTLRFNAEAYTKPVSSHEVNTSPAATTRTECVEFDNVPVAADPAQPVLVNQTKTTPEGVALALSKVALVTPMAFPGQTPVQRLVFVAHWQPPALLPGLKITEGFPIFNDKPMVEFSNGEAPAGQPQPSLYDDSIRMSNDGPKDAYSISVPAPSTAAKTATVRFYLTEDHPTFVQSQYILDIPFTVPESAVTPPTASLPATTQRTKIAAAPLDDQQQVIVTSVINKTNPYRGANWEIRFVIDPPISPDKSSWTPDDNIQYSYGDTTGSTGFPGMQPSVDEAGVPYVPGEQHYRINIMGSRTGPQPSSVTVLIHWKKYTRTSYSAAFHALKIPAIGAVTNPNITIPIGQGGTIELVKLGYFSQQNSISDRMKAADATMDPPNSGLAAVFVCTTDGSTGASIGPNLDLDYQVTDAHDETGLNLVRFSDSEDGNWAYDVLAAGDPPKLYLQKTGPDIGAFTVPLYPPAPGAKYAAITLAITKSEVQETKMTELDNIPLPPTTAAPP